MKVVIDLSQYTDVQKAWLLDMFKNEIEDTNGTLSNDILWSKGAETDEEKQIHLENEHCLGTYIDNLKDIVRQMDKENEPLVIRDIDDTSMYGHHMISEKICDFKIKYNKSKAEAKADAGKPQLSLAPIEQLWIAIARVREYGVKKYEKENWKTVEVSRYYDALYRHMAACLNNPHAVDSESGLPHLYHVGCNLSFILELDEELKDANRTNNKKN